MSYTERIFGAQCQTSFIPSGSVIDTPLFSKPEGNMNAGNTLKILSATPLQVLDKIMRHWRLRSSDLKQDYCTKTWEFPWKIFIIMIIQEYLNETDST